MNTTFINTKILVAEDDDANQRVAQLFLSRHGFDVTVVATGVDAVKAAEQGAFALIIMDCQMPIMDGIEATRRIRAAGIETPIIAMTANFDGSDRERCLTAGMNDFITKPVDFGLLLDVLNKWIGGDRR